ncbi:MAG: Imm50 family immunity protein [Thermoguttaceae bacterium]
MEHHQNIRNNERLTSIYGRWPSFHDAEVIWMRFDRRATSLGNGPTVEALIHTFEMTSEVNSAGFYVLRNHVLVHLRFSRVMELILDGFNHQNALLVLSIEDIRHRQMEHLNFEVKFDTSFGLEASFQCQDIEVVDVQPCDNDGLSLSGQMNDEESAV